MTDTYVCGGMLNLTQPTVGRQFAAMCRGPYSAERMLCNNSFYEVFLSEFAQTFVLISLVLEKAVVSVTLKVNSTVQLK